ncbi:MAG: methyltransferase [Burkholderiales bacterium]
MIAAAARLRLVQGLFFVSGFCGLIYESIWSHYLKLFLGHAAYAQSVVLVVFIGGMAGGAWAAGRYAERIARPLAVYAAAEFAVGWAGILFHAVFVAATAWAYDTLLPATCSVDRWCVSSWALAALLILPQSVLLGATFPLMTSGLLRLAPQDPGRRIGLLYFLNSLGAVFGVLASVFVIIPLVGLPGASRLAGVLNVLLAVAVYALARGAERTPGIAPRPAAAARAGVPAPARLLLVVAALTGLSSFGYEIAWIRMLSLVLGASTHAFELMLASFILGLALGGAWIRRRIDRLHAPRLFLAVVQVAMGLAALASVVLYDRAFDAMAWLIATLTKTDSGYLLFNVGSAAIAMAIMLPATFAAGMTLPLITFILLRDRLGERAIGYVYAWNTLGAIAGVLLAVHAGLPLVGVKGTLIAAAAIDVALGVYLIGRSRLSRAGVAAATFAALAVVATAAAPWALEIDPRKALAGVYRTGLATLAGDTTVLFNRDGKTATVSVSRNRDGIVTLRTNGKPDASANLATPDQWVMSDEATMILSAALPLAHAPRAEDVAIIGFGSGMTTATFLDAPTVRRVDTIEIEPMMVEGARHFLPAVERAYSDPRSHVVIDDAKSYFAKAGRRYDIIVSEPSNPWVAGVASLFTEEFYAQAARHLKEGGVLAQWIQAYEFDARLLGSIVAAVRTAFPDVALYNTAGTDVIMIASRGGVARADASSLFAHPALAARLAHIGVAAPADFSRRGVIGSRQLDAMFAGADVRPNSDYFPFVDVHAPAARFKGSRVDVAIEIFDAPVPVRDLVDGRPPPDALPPLPPPFVPGLADEWADARLAYEFVAGAGFAAGEEPPDVRGADAIRSARIVLVDCVPASSAAAPFDGVVELAGAFAQVLPPAAMDAYADLIDRSRCRARLPDAAANWSRLFRAVGRRDAGATADTAALLLERGDLTARQREYALAAAVAGYLGSGRAALAREALEENDDLVAARFRETSWMRFLRAAASR